MKVPNPSTSKKLLVALLPAVLAILFSLGVELALAKAPFSVRVALDPVSLALCALLTLSLINSSRRWLGTPRPPAIGGARALLYGIIAGLAVSFASGALYRAVLATAPAEPGLLLERLALRGWGNIGPAVLEEVGFRGGTVFFLADFWGPLPALLGGSVPFGLAHLASGLLGQPVPPAHILGTAVAGLLLSALFLRYGLLACIGCHWAWNSLAFAWTRVLHIQGAAPEKVFEGSWTTIAVLAAASILLLGERFFKCARPDSPPSQ